MREEYARFWGIVNVAAKEKNGQGERI
jgi:hypothetical protein